MRNENSKINLYKGMTLLEMVIALAIIVIISAAMLPQVKKINDSWASNKAQTEVVQNTRVLIGHLNRNLANAVQITAVSQPWIGQGFIEFENNDGTILRYSISVNNYVQFGPVGNPDDLAGPVGQLRFTCYSKDDFVNPTTEPEKIRFIKAEVVMINPGPGMDKTFTTSIYLRANAGLDFETVEPGDFGSDSTAGTNLISTKNWQVASKADLSCVALITSISAYIKAPPPRDVRFAIYTDSAGEPGDLIVQTDTVTTGLPFFGWTTIDITPTEISPGTYWLALAVTKQNIDIRQSAFGLGQLRIKTGTDAATNGFDPVWGVSESSASRSVSIYAVGDCLLFP